MTGNIDLLMHATPGFPSCRVRTPTVAPRTPGEHAELERLDVLIAALRAVGLEIELEHAHRSTPHGFH